MIQSLDIILTYAIETGPQRVLGRRRRLACEVAIRADRIIPATGRIVRRAPQRKVTTQRACAPCGQAAPAWSGRRSRCGAGKEEGGCGASRARQVGLENKGLENKVVQIMESYCVQDLLLVFQNRDPQTDLVPPRAAALCSPDLLSAQT